MANHALSKLANNIIHHSKFNLLGSVTSDLGPLRIGNKVDVFIIVARLVKKISAQQNTMDATFVGTQHSKFSCENFLIIQLCNGNSVGDLRIINKAFERIVLVRSSPISGRQRHYPSGRLSTSSVVIVSCCSSIVRRPLSSSVGSSPFLKKRKLKKTTNLKIKPVASTVASATLARVIHMTCFSQGAQTHGMVGQRAFGLMVCFGPLSGLSPFGQLGLGYLSQCAVAFALLHLVFSQPRSCYLKDPLK